VRIELIYEIEIFHPQRQRQEYWINTFDRDRLTISPHLAIIPSKLPPKCAHLGVQYCIETKNQSGAVGKLGHILRDGGYDKQLMTAHFMDGDIP